MSFVYHQGKSGYMARRTFDIGPWIGTIVCDTATFIAIIEIVDIGAL